MRTKRDTADIIESSKRRWPLAHKAAFPRNMEVPKGYVTPELFAAMMVAHLRVATMGMKELPHITGYSTTGLLIANRVPTYFIADEFAEAAANTILPGDFRFSELKWPMPAQLFVLSDEFCLNYYDGLYAPFLAMGLTKAGNYPAGFGKLPQTEFQYPTFVNYKDRVVMDHSFWGAEPPVTYNGAYPLEDRIEIIQEAPFFDATILELRLHGDNITPEKALATREEEITFTTKASQLLIKLMLIITELPSMVEHGKLTRNAIVTQQGRIKLPQLYSPNVIGRRYVMPRMDTQRTGVVSTSRKAPKFLYRRGHWAWVAKRFKHLEFISVDQMPRLADGSMDFDRAGPETEAKFRACHERQWIQGFVFKDEEADPGQN